MKVRVLNIVTDRFTHEATGIRFVPTQVKADDGRDVIVGSADVEEEVAEVFRDHPHFRIVGPSPDDEVLDIRPTPDGETAEEPEGDVDPDADPDE